MTDVSLALAFAAGLLSFISPCVLALLPVYLAFLGETAGAVQGTASAAVPWRGPVVGQALLFVAGFGLVFVLLGTSAGLLGVILFRIDAVRQAAGVLVIGIGLVTTGVFGPLLDRGRIGVPADLLPAGRSTRALALGALVAVGWTPCIGPVLGAILTMGASTQDAWIAVLLLLAYTAGLAVPFLAAAVALPRLRRLLEALRRHHRAVQVASGIFIMAMGVLIYTNAFFQMSSLFQFFI
jgi:cytochrome c-type biogenesis protein